MDVSSISFKKRLIILSLFFGFFILLLLVTFSIKNKEIVDKRGIVQPTLVPIAVTPALQNGTPQSKIESAPSTKDNTLGKVTFTITNPGLPKTGTIYKISSSSIPTDTIMQIKQRLAPQGVEKTINTPSGPVTLITQGTKTLTVYSYSRTITYTDVSGSIVDTASDQFVDKAENFINSLALPINDTDPELKYFSKKTGDLIEVGAFVDADIVDVSFRESLKDIVVYRQFGSDSRTHVWLSKDGGVLKFTYLYPPVYQPATTIGLPTLESAQNSVIGGAGTIVSLGSSYQQIPLKNPDSTSFSNVSFGYFSDTKNNILTPIFVFSGEAMVGETNYPIVVYLPVGETTNQPE